MALKLQEKSIIKSWIESRSEGVRKVDGGLQSIEFHVHVFSWCEMNSVNPYKAPKKN